LAERTHRLLSKTTNALARRQRCSQRRQGRVPGHVHVGPCSVPPRPQSPSVLRSCSFDAKAVPTRLIISGDQRGFNTPRCSARCFAGGNNLVSRLPTPAKRPGTSADRIRRSSTWPTGSPRRRAQTTVHAMNLIGRILAALRVAKTYCVCSFNCNRFVQPSCLRYGGFLRPVSGDESPETTIGLNVIFCSVAP
jgi:hypothetical protein